MATNKITTRIIMRNDKLSAWENSQLDLLQGEIALAKNDNGDYEIRVGTGDKTWNELSSENMGQLVINKHFDVTSKDAMPETAHEGDTCVVKELIANGKYSYTAYVWNGTAWAAMDGNYDASNVFFSDDLTYTTGIGVIGNPSGGSGTLETAGTSVEDLFKKILAKESTSITVDRAVTVSYSVSNNSTAEIGTTLTTFPTFTAKVDDIGSWTSYGGKNSDGNTVAAGATGITVNATIKKGNVDKASKTGLVKNGTVTYTAVAGDFTTTTYLSGGTSLTCDLTWTHTASTTKPVTNLGNYVIKGTVNANNITNITETAPHSEENFEKALGQIPAKNDGSGSKTWTFTGLYPAYYAFTTAPTANPTALTATNGDVTSNGVTFKRLLDNFSQTTFTASSSWYELFYLVPTCKQNSASWSGRDSNNVDLAVEAKTQATVTFKDNTSATYNVYVVRNAAQYGATTCTMKFA